jgi:hypothetical protein
MSTSTYSWMHGARRTAVRWICALGALAGLASMTQPAAGTDAAQTKTATPVVRATATRARVARTPTPSAKTTAAAKAGALTPAKAYEIAKKDPCGLVKTADVGKLVNTRTLDAAPETRGAEYLCVYSAGSVYYNVVSISRDDDGSVLANSLARFDVNKGCGRDKKPSDADLAPYKKMALADKLKQLVEKSNGCGGAYKAAPALGANAYLDSGNLLIVVDKYLLNTYVQGDASGETAIKLARLAFAR